MPSNVTKFKIFIASPSELAEDRIIIDKVISELNLSYGEQNSIVLEALKWETHSAPGMSNIHAQEVINKDIGNDYDIFIGLLWKTFGSPTENAGSGTEEEFQNAYNRFQENSNSIQILFYFKDKPFSPSQLNIEQLTKIQNFKNNFNKEHKGLYFTYNDSNQLEQYLRIHIQKRVSNLKDSFENNLTEENIISKGKTKLDVQEQLGVFEYQEIIEEDLQEATLALERITEAIYWIGDQLTSKTDEINAITRVNNQPNRNDVRIIFKKISRSLETFADRIRQEIPIYQENFEHGINSMSKMLAITNNDMEVDLKEKEEAKNGLKEMIEQLESGIETMTGFLNTIISLPRVSKDINIAKSKVADTLQEFLKNINVSVSIAKELLDNFDN